MKETHERYRPNLVFLVSLVVLSLIAAISWPLLNRWQHSTAEQAGGTVRIGAGHAPASLDIRTQDGNAVTQALLGNVYQTLVGLDEHARPVPQIASSWERSPDGLTYTFHLRENQTFEDGSPLDSSAVLWSMEQTMKNKYLGHQHFDNLAKVTNPTANEVVIELKNPDAQLPYELAGRPGIVYNRGARVNYDKESAGSGPYTVDSFKPGQELVLRKSKTYRGPHQAKSAKIIFSYSQDSKGQAQQVASGKLDAAVDLSASEIGAAKTSKPELKLSTGLTDDNVVLAFNHSKTAITSDERVRQAISHAVDRKAIADTSGGTQKVLEGPVNELSVGYDPAYKALPHDSKKAASLASYFSQSAYGSHLRLVYDKSLGQDIGNTIKDQLAQANMPIEVIMLDHDAFQEQVINKHDYELTLFNMSNDDVSQFANPHSPMAFDDTECQQFFRLVTGAKSDGDYASQLKQFAQTLSNKQASVWLTQKTPVNAKSNKLKGLPDNMGDRYIPAWELKA